jgi:hypothetical protein
MEPPKAQGSCAARVRELFEIRGRRLVVVTDVAIKDWPLRLRVRAGDAIQIRNRAGPPIDTTIAGIEHLDPYSPEREMTFMLAPGLTKSMVEIGAELWFPAAPGPTS